MSLCWQFEVWALGRSYVLGLQEVCERIATEFVFPLYRTNVDPFDPEDKQPGGLRDPSKSQSARGRGVSGPVRSRDAVAVPSKTVTRNLEPKLQVKVLGICLRLSGGK